MESVYVTQVEAQVKVPTNKPQHPQTHTNCLGTRPLPIIMIQWKKKNTLLLETSYCRLSQDALRPKVSQRMVSYRYPTHANVSCPNCRLDGRSVIEILPDLKICDASKMMNHGSCVMNTPAHINKVPRNPSFLHSVAILSKLKNSRILKKGNLSCSF